MVLELVVPMLVAAVTTWSCGAILDGAVAGLALSSRPPVRSPAASLLATAAFNQYCCCSVLLAKSSSGWISSRHLASSGRPSVPKLSWCSISFWICRTFGFVVFGEVSANPLRVRVREELVQEALRPTVDCQPEPHTQEIMLLQLQQPC